MKKEVAILKKIIIIGLIFVSILLSGCNKKTLSSAEFTNLTPATIKMDNLTYQMTDEVLFTNEVDEQIGEITINRNIVSYSEDQNPYKHPSELYKIKDIDVEEALAILVNEKLYKANIDKDSINN